MNFKSLTLICTAALMQCILLPSCSNTSGDNAYTRYETYDRPATLPTNRSKVKVKVSLKNQMAYVMEGSKPLLIMPVTVGRSRTPTPKGNFRIFRKKHYHRAYTHGYAISPSGNRVIPCYLRNKPRGWTFKGTPMPYWCEFKSAYGFHTGWMKPFPASHGCLRMHKNVSPKFFQLVSHGTPVNVAYSQPEDTTIGSNIPRPPDSTPFPGNPHSIMVTNRFFTLHKKPTYN